MEYRLVETSGAQALEQDVNALIAQGWLPTGGVAVATYGAGTWWYYQAMVRRTTPNE
ncbi:MAG: DUF1737 domain-containing protein [Planctomycetaceae bacterium]